MVAAPQGDFTTSTPFLLALANATYEGPYGQAHEVSGSFCRVFIRNEAYHCYIVLQIGPDGMTPFKTQDGETRYQVCCTRLYCLAAYHPTSSTGQQRRRLRGVRPADGVQLRAQLVAGGHAMVHTLEY